MYMDSLEQKCEDIKREGLIWKDKCEELKKQNESLSKELTRLNEKVNNFHNNISFSTETGADTHHN